MLSKDDLERAKIAMEEYKVLHAELLQRNTTLVQMGAAAVAGVVAVAGFIAAGTLSWLPGVCLILAILAAILVIWQIVDSDAKNACQRIGEIEEYVNKLVGGNPYNPLSWERRFGILNRNYTDRFNNFDFEKRGLGEPVPRSSLAESDRIIPEQLTDSSANE